MAAGVFIRHFFNLRHRGRVEWRYPLIGVVILAGAAIALAPKPPARAAVNSSDFAKVQSVVTQRCVSCHSAAPTQPGFAAAPAGVLLDKPELLRQHAARVYQQTVVLKAMPIANLTGITDQERALIGAWFESGAK